MNSDCFVIFIDTIGSKKVGISSSFRSEFRSEYSELRRISDRKPIGSVFRPNRRSRANPNRRSRANPTKSGEPSTKVRRSFEVSTKFRSFDEASTTMAVHQTGNYNGYDFFLFYTAYILLKNNMASLCHSELYTDYALCPN